ncbi:MAG: hypothetical protein KGJ60_08905 [Verrucomicrobiota bacterium]|nr:hypothetical protein [Verrucomicrobiota bacterium]
MDALIVDGTVVPLVENCLSGMAAQANIHACIRCFCVVLLPRAPYGVFNSKTMRFESHARALMTREAQPTGLPECAAEFYRR